MALTEAEGDKLCAQAHKLVNPSLLSFRLKGNWEEATPIFEKAGACYKVVHFATGLEDANLVYIQT